MLDSSNKRPYGEGGGMVRLASSVVRLERLIELPTCETDASWWIDLWCHAFTFSSSPCTLGMEGSWGLFFFFFDETQNLGMGNEGCYDRVEKHRFKSIFGLFESFGEG